MRGLKVFLFITLVSSVIFGLLLLIFPTQMAEAKMGPQDIPSARYMAVAFLAFALATWYAFRNPTKNVAVVLALITLWALGAVVGLWNGITGAEGWGTALPGVILSGVVAAGLAYFYPRGESPT